MSKAALALGVQGCGAHEYYYGNVSIVLGATAAKGAVRCHQQTGRASVSNFGSWASDTNFQNDRQFANYLLKLIQSYVGRFRQPIIYTNNGCGVV
jgi:hypothetical protein